MYVLVYAIIAVLTFPLGLSACDWMPWLRKNHPKWFSPVMVALGLYLTFFVGHGCITLWLCLKEMSY